MIKMEDQLILFCDNCMKETYHDLDNDILGHEFYICSKCGERRPI